MFLDTSVWVRLGGKEAAHPSLGSAQRGPADHEDWAEVPRVQGPEQPCRGFVMLQAWGPFPGPFLLREAQKMKPEPSVPLPASRWPHFPITPAPRLLHSRMSTIFTIQVILGE